MGLFCGAKPCYGPRMLNPILALGVMVVVSHEKPMNVPQTAADKSLVKLSEAYVDASFAIAPVAGSYVGYRKYDGRWPDYSPLGVQNAIATYKDLQTQLIAVESRALSPAFA